MDKKIVTIIQTRRGSSRFPDKVMMPLQGKPLFVRQVERIMASELCGRIVVATTNEKTDDEIEKICRQEGFEYYRGHSDDLIDRHFQVALKCEADVVIKIPSDCPLIDPAIIDNVISFYLEHSNEYDFVSNLHPPAFPDGNDVEVMTFTALEDAWKNAYKKFEREHTTPYIWDHPEKFRIGNVKMENGADYSMSHRFVVDYEEDYLFVKEVFDKLYPQNPLFTMKDILGLLDEHRDIYNMNNHYAGVNWYRKHLHELNTITPDQTKVLNEL